MIETRVLRRWRSLGVMVLWIGLAGCSREAGDAAAPAVTQSPAAAPAATKPAAIVGAPTNPTPVVAAAPATSPAPSPASVPALPAASRAIDPTLVGAELRLQNTPIWGVFVGNDPKAVPQFDQWLGSANHAILSYTGDASWADYEGSVGWAMGLWRPLDRRVLWSVALIPRNVTLADAANGSCNAHYKSIATKLASWRPNEPVLYIRTGWEFNGGWFHYKAVGHAQDFIGAWRQFVTTFRSVSPRFRFDWCPAGCDWMPMNAEDAYPGDDYVDIVGLDVYDNTKYCKVLDPEKRWNDIYLHGKTGLTWHKDFAAKHNKPMSYPEWGGGGRDVGDNPLFIEKMHRWFLDNHVVYASYWNSDSDYKGRMSGDEYPQAGAKYKALFTSPTLP